MTDGKRLYTVMLIPTKASQPLPLLMSRTPYGARGNADPRYVMRIYGELAADGYIFVFQDIRGLNKSEGRFEMNRPPERFEGLRAGRAEGVSLQLARGEILGIAGLQGMGQLDLFLALYGMAERRAGQFECDGRAVSLDSPGAALSAGMGISLVPEDRKTEALFLGLDGTLNAALPVLPRFVRRGLLDMDAVRRSVAGVFRRMKVDERALWTRVGAFSGGNQQKIAIAKWLLAQSRILLLYDPTRGIDVGTKHEIYRLMRDFAAEGGSILFYSTEVSELVHMADRVLVLYQGRVAAEFSQGEIGETSILAAALGGLPEKLLA